MTLSRTAKNVLHALTVGHTLKSHRYLDGTKTFKLHDLAGATQTVPRHVVDDLLAQGYVTSNHKFPAATYMITPVGRSTVEQQTPPGGHNAPSPA